MKRNWNALIFLLMGFFLLNRLVSGTLYYYINQRFAWLIILAIGGFVLVALSYFYGSSAAHDHDHHDHVHGHDHTHASHNHSLSWTGLLLVTMPVILGLLVPPKPLGAAAMQNREVSLGSVSSLSLPGNANILDLKQKTDKDIMDWLIDFQRSKDPTEFEGETAHIVGFVYRDGRFEEDDVFMVSRFALTCCVADATAIGLITRWPAAVAMEQDQWVEVKGHFEAGEFYGQTLPILVAESVTPTEAPEQPYLYYY